MVRAGGVEKPVATSRRWLSFFVIAASVLGSSFCLALVVILLAPRFLSVRMLPAKMLSRDWQAFAPALAGAFGLGLVVAALILLVIAVRGAGRSSRLKLWVLGFGALSLALIAVDGLFYVLSPYHRYGLHEPASAQRGRLDSLNVRGVVATYFQTGDLSVQYWLLDEKPRSLWHSASYVPNLEVARGVDDLKIELFTGRWNPADAEHRSFHVTYLSHAPNDSDQPPGPRDLIVILQRESDRCPWRIERIDHFL
jgi:hypothetical protein